MAEGNNIEGLDILEKLLTEAGGIKEEEFSKWYEKKRNIFNIGVKKLPTKEEFMKYLNYALNLNR